MPPLPPLLPEDAPRPAEISVLGVSIPRAGHHYLSRLLRGYFGESLRYCSLYNVRGCCKRAPCVRTEGRRIVFQKSHDFTGRMPKDVAGGLYVVQHRRPVSAALSSADRRAERGRLKAPGEGLVARWRYYDFLAGHLAYYKRFHDKWVAAAPAGALLIDHADLEARPAEALRPLIAAIDGAVDEEMLAATVAALANLHGHTHAYRPRVVDQSPFFDRAALAALESAVIDQCPAFGYRASLGGRHYRRHPVWWLAKLRHGYGRAAKNRTGEDVE